MFERERERVCVFEDMCVMGCERGCECEKSYVGVRVFEDVYVRMCIEDVQGGVDVKGRVCVCV